MAYIDAAKYASITGRAQAEATAARLKRASRLLDSRIGNYLRIDDDANAYDGFKLDLDDLRSWQKEAVEEWTAWMTAALFLSGDAPDTFQRIQLGRFSVTESKAEEDYDLPNQVRYADMQLRDAKLINTHVRSSRFAGTQEEDEEDNFF